MSTKIEIRRDVGCDDLDKAARSRDKVKNRLYTIAYEQVENYFTHTPLTKQLPLWIPTDELPVVGEKDWKQSGGTRGGFTEIDEGT